MRTETHKVPKLSKPVRLQEYGVGLFTMAFTKSALKKALKRNYITVNDKPASTATWIRSEDSIRLHMPDKADSRRESLICLNILFEDDFLAAIYKPAGVLVSGNKFKTIANSLSYCIQHSRLPDAIRPQPVHRLDFSTTGILLAGKTSKSIRLLNKMFERQEIRKSYIAIAIGSMEPEGFIDKEIDGKKAETRFRICSTVPSQKFGQLNLILLNPLTGRRHQLRKHLENIGNPILGDKTYGTGNTTSKGKGMYLHAFSIHFIHLFTLQKTEIFAPIPQRFKKIFVDIEEILANEYNRSIRIDNPSNPLVKN